MMPDFKNLQCDSRKTTSYTVDCAAGIYVRLSRPGRGDIEGITGLTATWRSAEPIDPRYGRTAWQFQHCQESD